MSEKCLKPGNKPLNHIFNINEIHVCLVCKENIEGTLSLNRDIHLSNHINSKIHKKNIRALFKLCVPDWNGSYVEIIPNLVFDVSLEKNESSFVSKTGNNNFDCLVCHENIAQGTDPNEIITSVINHINTDFHLINVIDGVFWVHHLDDELAFIMFHKSEVHCSICKRNVQNVITCPLRRAVDHLKCQHDIVYKVPRQQQANDSFTEEKSICVMLKSTTLTGNEQPHVGASSSSNKDLDAELSLDTCEYEADEFKGSVGSDDSVDDSEDGSNEPIDICVDALKCPECGEFIEVYNENADFSMDVHLQKHKPLMSVYTESEYDYQDDVDYTCPICQETIQIFNKNLELSFKRHFEENRHEHEGFTLADSEDKNRFDFLSRVFDILPDDMRNQQSVFVMDGNEVFCKLCNCTVSSSKIVPVARQVFIDHLSSTFHLHQFKASSQFLFMAVVNYNKQSFLQVDAKEQDDIFKRLCRQNPIIESNKQFIEKRQILYFCTVCNKHICYSPKENIQVLNFVLHLNGKLHKVVMKQLKEQKCTQTFDYSSSSQKNIDCDRKKKIKTIILQVAKEFSVVRLNQFFINEKDGDFICELCQVLIKFSPTGSGLRKHCASLLHNTELSERILGYVSQFDNNILTTKYRNILSRLTTLPILKPHAHFINHNGEDFYCIVCSMAIHGSTNTGKNVKSHIFSTKHRKKCFNVICNQDRSREELKDKNKIIPTLSTNKTENSEKTTTIETHLRQERAQKILKCLVTYSWVIRKYVKFIEVRRGYFFCKMCKELIICNCRGTHLKEHFQIKKHNL